MRRFMLIQFLTVACLLLFAWSCTQEQVHKVAEAVHDGATVASVATGGPATPWGLILGGLGSIAGVIASLTGAHAVAGAQAQGSDPHPVSDFLANHTYFYPLITSALTVLNPYVLHLSPDHLAAVAGMLGVAFGTQAGSSLIVKAGTPAAAPETPKS
jgi:hypothetical protein